MKRTWDLTLPPDLAPGHDGYMAALNRRFASIEDALAQAAAIGGSAGGPAAVRYGAHASRPSAAAVDDGSLYVETDRSGLIYQARSGKWIFSAGIHRADQAALAGLALGANDAGVRVFVNTYQHLLYWNGAGWQWADGDAGSGYIQGFAITPGAGWQICDGSAGIAYLKGDGTLGSFNVPNLTGSPAYPKLGAAYTGTINAAVAPTINASGAATNAGTGALAASSSGHLHTATLPGDPVANLVLVPYFRL
jgi:hypothetical protein